MASLEKNTFLEEINATGFDDRGSFPLAEWLGIKSPLGPNQLPPVAMFTFDKGAFINAILRFYSWQFETISKHMVDFFRRLDKILCDSPQRIDAVLICQVVLHLVKTEPKDIGGLEQLNKSIAQMLNISASQTQFDLNNGAFVDDIKKFLNHPMILKLFFEQLENYFPFLGISMASIQNALSKINIYVTNASILAFRGWTVTDGIVVVRGNLFPYGDRATADIFSLALHEASHYILRCFANDFLFSSPQKNEGNDLKDPLIPDKGLEFGGCLEIALFSMQVKWQDTDEDVAKNFVSRAMDMASTELITKDEKNKLVPRTGISCSSGFDADSWSDSRFVFC